MTEKEKYIEEVGIFYEKYGLPKMAGRILGCLISSETDNNSFENLRDILKASKGSISGNINLLLNQNMIEKHTISGDRKSYYRIAMNSLENIMEAKTKSVTEFRIILEKGLNINPNQNSLNFNNISDILDYYNFLEIEIPLLRVKWEKRNK
ncbi:MAG: hypothetical protein JXR60_00430 [Bacteroidales bacterium]|nr:hypothetical protein [Bacteroidales bacterium]